jgi:hypothetical protein
VTRKLIIISGPDRVGKSTVCSELTEQLGEENCEVIHLAEPPLDQEDPYMINREKIQEWVASGKEWCFFDRSYPCSMVFEEHRRGNAGHLSHIVDLEIELMRCADTFKVGHTVFQREWNWSAKHHLVEIDLLYPTAAEWAKRDKYIARMKEHELYYKQIKNFVTNVTAFPTYWHHASPWPDSDATTIIEEMRSLLK